MVSNNRAFGATSWLCVVLRNVCGYLTLVLTLLTVLFLSVFVGPSRFAPLIKILVRLMLRAFGIAVIVQGAEQLDPHKAYVYLLNHVSWLDHMIAFAYTPGFVTGLHAVEYYRIPLYGRVARRWGMVPINRHDLKEAKGSCDLIQKHLNAGISLALFPEGTRSHDGGLAPFKKGAFHIAIDAKAIVVPMSLKGLYPLCPRGTKFVRSGTFEIVFATPIRTDTLSKADLPILQERVRGEILRALG